MYARNNSSEELNSKRDELDRANAEETRIARTEVIKIKQAYIEVNGMPHYKPTGMPLNGIASHNDK